MNKRIREIEAAIIAGDTVLALRLLAELEEIMTADIPPISGEIVFTNGGTWLDETEAHDDCASYD